MGLVNTVRDYITRMMNEVSGMKVLLVDKETLGIVSLVMSQSEIMHKEVFLVENVDVISNELMMHLKAVCFLRPVNENINHLKKHLNHPRFGEYHIFFSNIVPTPFLHILADADEHESVQQIQEFYADYYAVDPFHFTLNLTNNNYLSYVSAEEELNNSLKLSERSVESIVSIFLSLKRRPVIRYQKNSETCQKIAQDTARVMYEKEKPLFDFRKSENYPLLLIIDRRDDAVTPLLNQWTYQAMVHELLGIHNNTVSLKHAQNISEDFKDIVVSSNQDEFFKTNMFDNFGDVGSSVARLVDDLQKIEKKNKKMQSIEEMQRMLESYPEHRREAGNVSKHVTLMSELHAKVNDRKLMIVSQVEQDLVCSSGEAVAFESVLTLLEDEKVMEVDKLRLVMLYALKYEKENARHFELLISKFTSKAKKFKPGLIYTLLHQCGKEKRVGDLFGNRDILNMMARNVKRGLKGIENVYTQHEPLLSSTIENAMKGKLREGDYPFIGTNILSNGRPQDLVIFVVGGTTYSESRIVSLYNSKNPNSRVIVGGTAILNSNSFLSDMLELYQMESKTSMNSLHL